MSQIFVRIISRYAPIITFPVAVVLGFIGYNIEGQLSSKSTPYLDHSINEEREKRLLSEKETAQDKPTTIFDRNDPNKLR
jgi:hypothetical protein